MSGPKFWEDIEKQKICKHPGVDPLFDHACPACNLIIAAAASDGSIADQLKQYYAPAFLDDIGDDGG